MNNRHVTHQGNTRWVAGRLINLSDKLVTGMMIGGHASNTRLKLGLKGNGRIEDPRKRDLVSVLSQN